ncbi:MAG TPA: hypothetical protein VHR72_11920 [Gemmataceae bacterium]|nr:hypothetical protein [Gemmataceae bacterium]
MKRLGLLGLSLLLLSPSARKTHAQNPIDFERAVSTMEASEKRFDRIQFHVNGRHGKLNDLNDPSSLIPSPEFEEGRVIFELHGGRYRVDLNSVGRWTAGAAPFAAQKVSLAFDGKNYESFSTQKAGTQLPNEDDWPGKAARGKGDGTDRQLNPNKVNCGLRFFRPFFPLSKSLRENRAKADLVEISENKEGNWEIKATYPPATDYVGDPSKDPSRGFLTIVYSPVKEAVLSAAYANGSPPEVYQRIVCELQKAKGSWVPDTYRSFNTIDKTAQEIRYSKVQINQPVDDGEFRFDIPQKARVTDHLEKKVYQQGDAAVDEAKAARDYRISQHLPADQSVFSSARFWILTTLIALALVAGFLFWRYRRSRTVRA